MLLPVLSLAVLTSVLPLTAALACPPGCACAALDTLREYNCSGLLVRRTVDNTRAEIDCDGQELVCSQVPQLGMRRRLTKLEVQQCVPGAGLRCALGALGAEGTDILILKQAGAELGSAAHGLGLRQLWIYDSDAQKSVPLEALRTETNVTKLLISGGGPFQLDPLPPTGLTHVDISAREIPRLGGDLFREQKQLVELRLWKNGFEEIDVNAFRGLTSLVSLDLNGNPLKTLEPGTFSHCPALKELLLYGLKGRVTELRAGVFSGLRTLEALSIENAAGVSMVVASGSFANMSALANLTVSADVPALPSDVFNGTTALRRLDLQYNQFRSLPEGIFGGMNSLTMLDLSHNRLENITGALFASLRSLREVYLHHNLITVLPSLLFTTESLEVADFSHNRIREVQENPLAAVSTLDLSHNKLTWGASSLPGTPHMDGLYYGSEERQSPLSSLGELRNLDLSHNHIARVLSDWTWVMVRLRRLDLSYNDITELDRSDVNFLGADDLVVDFRYNNISHISMFVDFNQKVSYPIFKLGNNPYNCDCTMYDILKNINNRVYNFDSEDASCAHPSYLSGVTINTVPTDLLTCQIPDTETPVGCECLTRPSRKRIECVCIKLPKVLPNPEYSGFQSMDLKLKTYQDLSDLPKYVTSVNLTDMGLETVPFIPKTVKEIDLSNNRIKVIPIDVIAQNLTLHIGGNPIDCKCGNSDELDALQRYLKTGNVKDDVTCEDGKELELIDIGAVCSVIIATMLGAVTCVFAFVCATMAFMYYKYSIEIKVWLYRHGWEWILKDESLDAEKTYDIFLSYSHEDETFISQMLLPKLDIEYKVCVHTRDFIPGESIAEQIYRSVSESRRTLIVFSNNFVKSFWGIEEFRASYLQGLNDRRVRAVVILLEDIDMSTVSEDVKTYLSLTTYVKWGDSGFWPKLRYALPRKVKAKDVRLKMRTEVAVEKLSKGFNGIVVHGNANKGFDDPKLEKSALNVVLNEDGKLFNKGYLETKPLDDWRVV